MLLKSLCYVDNQSEDRWSLQNVYHEQYQKNTNFLTCVVCADMAVFTGFVTTIDFSD